MNLVERIVRVLLAEEATFKCDDCGAHGDAGSDKCPECGSDEYYPVNDNDEYESIQEIDGSYPLRHTSTFKCDSCGEECEAGVKECPKCGSEDILPVFDYPSDDESEYESISENGGLTCNHPDCKSWAREGAVPCTSCGRPVDHSPVCLEKDPGIECRDCARGDTPTSRDADFRAESLREDVADTILQQLRAASGAGGLGGLSRWGAREFIKSSDSLMFRVGRRGKITIKYDTGPDSYTVTLYKLGNNHDVKELKSVDDIYFDQLVDVIGRWISEFNP